MKRFCCGIPTNPAHIFAPVPTGGSTSVASCSPGAGLEAGGTPIVIAGAGFARGIRQVSIGGAPVPFFTVDNDGQISARTPPGTGVVTVSVSWLDGSGFALSGGFTYEAALPATVIGIAPSSGSTAGSTHVVIEVDDSTGFISAAVDGVDITSPGIVDATHVEGDTVADTAGAKDVTVTNAGGTSAPLVGGFTYATPFNPATLPLTDWRKPDFAGFPWAANASAGPSNVSTEDTCVLGGTTPVAGRMLNGFTSARYNGTKMSSPHGGGGSRITATAGAVGALIWIESAAAGGGATPYNETQIYGEDYGYGWGFSVSADGVKVWQYTGTWPEIHVACSAGAWHKVWTRFSGGTREIRVDGGAWTSSATSAISLYGGTAGYTGCVNGAFSDLDIMERVILDSSPSDADCDNFDAYLLAKYGV